CCIGTAVGIQSPLQHGLLQSRKIMRGNDAIRIKQNKIISFGLFHAKIARKALAFVVLIVIAYVQPILVLLRQSLGGKRRSVFYDDYFYIRVILMQQTFQQFAYFFWAVINWNYNGKPHSLVKFISSSML